MSLINRMLSDLESRRGGNLRNVDSVIDGLQPSEAPAREPATKRRSSLVLASGVAGACAMGVFLWQPWKPAPVAPASAPMAAAPVTPAALPSPAPAPQAATPSAPQPSAGSVPVVIADAPAPSSAPPAVATAPDPVERTPGATAATMPDATAEPESPPAPARAMAAEKAPEPEASREPESTPEPEAAPPPAVAERAPESQRPAAAPAPRRPQNEDSSFVIANANTPAPTAELALALVDAGRPEEAEALLREGLAVQPDDTDAARVLGHLLLGQGDARGAREVLSAAPPPLADDTDYHALLAAAEQRSAEHAAAIRRYRDLLTVQPGNGQWLVGLGISLLAAGDRSGAGDAFQQALADPGLPRSLRSFAEQQAGYAGGGRP